MPDGLDSEQSATEEKILGRMTLERAGQRQRAVFAGETVAESGDALVLAEDGYPPRVYFPPVDVRMDLLTPSDRTSHCPWKGDATYWSIEGGGRTLENAAWAYPDPLPDLAQIKDHVSFYEDVEIKG